MVWAGANQGELTAQKTHSGLSNPLAPTGLRGMAELRGPIQNTQGETGFLLRPAKIVQKAEFRMQISTGETAERSKSQIANFLLTKSGYKIIFCSLSFGLLVFGPLHRDRCSIRRLLRKVSSCRWGSSEVCTVQKVFKRRG